jgi:23S rRNA (adenine2503-C2)-methyltransferase
MTDSAAVPHLFDLDPDALSRLVTPWGLPRFRAAQVLQWVYERHVADPAAMTNLSHADRALLAERLRWTTARIVQHQTAGDGTQKLLMAWPPAPAPAPGGVAGGQTECVMIPANDHEDDDRAHEHAGKPRRTACISSQVGCPVGCRFCASGLGGLEANLTAGQIVEQVWRLSSLLHEQGDAVGRVTHVVFMGMGEPMANFDAVTAAIRTLMAPWGPHISGRRITISTVGLPAQMRRLADLQLPVTLAISLHAPNDDIRRRIIPWAQFVSIDQLVEAGRYYFDQTGREVTLEYILLRQVNDRVAHARELACVAQRLRANVNLIRYNEVKGIPFDRPTSDDVQAFQRVLRGAGVNTHIRASRGRDIAAACGQLRHESRAQQPD